MNKPYLRLLLLLALSLLSLCAYADNAPNDNFLGMKFGAGVAVTWYGNNNPKRINKAEVVNGVVRVSEDTGSVARILLETHYFPYRNSNNTEGHGPFIAISPGSENVIDAIGGGWMYGWQIDKNTGRSINIGAGIIVEPKVTTLGDGINKNEPLPAGETNVRYKTVSRYGMVVSASFNF